MTILPTRAALEECAREPIHIPGAIQPFGALLAFALPGFSLTHVSANADAFVGLAPGTLAIGGDLRTILPRAFMHDLGNTLQATSISRTPERLLNVGGLGSDARFDVIAHVTASGAICEFTPVESTDARIDSGVLLRAMTARLARATSVDRLLAMAAQQVRAVTGFDRVMIYKFRDDASGVVVAESLRSGLEPYLGLHYPASDIPPQARELFRRQPLRQIPVVDYIPVPILPNGPDAAPLDLSLSQLRTSSPIHLEYLRNMGSVATLTISLLRAGNLWGLFACHHMSPRRLSSSTSAALELFAQVFALQLEAREQAAELAEVAHANDVIDTLRHANADRPIGRAIETIRSELADVLPHDGAALWIDGQADVYGSTPPVECFPELLRHIREEQPDGIFATDRLSLALPDALRYTAAASGVLAVPISRGRQDFLLFFRKEEVQTVNWGGDPNKALSADATGRIGPRQSFSAWKEIVRGASLPWKRTEMQVIEALQVRVLEFMLSHARLVDTTRRTAAESQSLLIAELGHRVKNIFALVRSVVRQSRTGASTVDEYAGDIERRIAALAVAHDQITQAGWRPASLRRLLEEQSRTWGGNDDERITLAGPAVLLDVRAVQAFALVLHEMMTNAAKYGALSVPGGTVAITWEWKGDDLAIGWRERGGPPVKLSGRRGFGTTVIEQTIPFEIRGNAEVRFPAQGVEADFVIPHDHVIAGQEEEGSGALPVPVLVDIRGSRILLVEDSMMIALDAQAMLEAVGGAVEIVSSVADGLHAIEGDAFTAAVLDINLLGETSVGLADALHARRIPFIFATGYGDQAHVPSHFRGVPKVSKPYDVVSITGAIGAAIAAAGGP